MSAPLVTAVMLTGHDARRRPLADLAIECFLNQTWEHKNLLIINQGERFNIPDPQIREFLVKDDWNIGSLPASSITIGMLRNIAHEYADAEYLINWDDDDYYHPERIAVQMDPFKHDDRLLGTVLQNRTVIDLQSGDFFARDPGLAACGGCAGSLLLRISLLLDNNIEHSYMERLISDPETEFLEHFPSIVFYPLENSPIMYHQTFTGLNWNNYWTIVEEPRGRDMIDMSDEEKRFTAHVLYKYQMALGLLSDEDSPYLHNYRQQQEILLPGVVCAPAC